VGVACLVGRRSLPGPLGVGGLVFEFFRCASTFFFKISTLLVQNSGYALGPLGGFGGRGVWRRKEKKDKSLLRRWIDGTSSCGTFKVMLRRSAHRFLPEIAHALSSRILQSLFLLCVPLLPYVLSPTTCTTVSGLPCGDTIVQFLRKLFWKGFKNYFIRKRKLIFEGYSNIPYDANTFWVWSACCKGSSYLT